jgi:hypothetical protein
MEAAFSNFLKEHKSVPSTRLTLIQFDDINDQAVQYMNVPVGSAENLHLRPRGNTPLLDAMCKAIDGTGRRLADLSESERPDQVLFVVITDGEENASKTYKRSDVSSRVRTQSDNYKWNFIYLGANQDAFKEAASLGINPNWTLYYNATPGGTTSAWKGLVGNTVAYASASGTSRGMAASNLLKFDEDQRNEAAESKTTNSTAKP